MNGLSPATFNRTILELKFFCDVLIYSAIASFNRTILELKFRYRLCPRPNQ